jgi:hypothetical protein
MVITRFVTRLLKCPEVDPTDAGELDGGCAQDYGDYLTPLGSAVEEAQKNGDERMIQILIMALVKIYDCSNDCFFHVKNKIPVCLNRRENFTLF